MQKNNRNSKGKSEHKPKAANTWLFMWDFSNTYDLANNATTPPESLCRGYLNHMLRVVSPCFCIYYSRYKGLYPLVKKAHSHAQNLDIHTVYHKPE